MWCYVVFRPRPLVIDFFALYYYTKGIKSLQLLLSANLVLLVLVVSLVRLMSWLNKYILGV